jgi:hypothetical protein
MSRTSACWNPVATLAVPSAIKSLDRLDRQIGVLRHDEQMTNGDVATGLGLEKSVASKSYTWALERFKKIPADLPGEIREA